MASPGYNRLAFRISAVVAVCVLAIGCVVGLFLSEQSIVLAVLLAVVAGVAAYIAVFAMVARRIELARQTLRESRKRRFESLASIPRDDDRDELDALVYQTYRAGRALQQEIERLERLENYRREYLGDVSHELRTPIFAISGFAETLLDGALEDEAVRRRFVEKIEANSHRLDALTRDLAEISRIETGELKMTMTPFELPPIIKETAESLDMIAQDRGVSMNIQIPEVLPSVMGDRERIQQVIANLVENAIKYNDEGGQVEIIARLQPDNSVQVVVVDDGIGIPEEAISRLTERFFRVDKSRSRAQGGTGLGLAIVKHILEAHGQRLMIESRPNYGSRFSFKLPVIDARERVS